MKWTHLPNAGGLYDQHPVFMDDLYKIMVAQSEADQRKHAKEMQNAKKPKTTGRGGSRMRH